MRSNIKYLVVLIYVAWFIVPCTACAQLGGADESDGEGTSRILLGDVHFGITAGAVSSSLPVADNQVSRRLGYAIGGFLTFDYRGPLALQPGILYLQEGATLRTTTSVIVEDGEVIDRQRTEENAHISFIELPVILKYQFLTDSPTSLNALVGLVAGYSTTLKGLRDPEKGPALGATLGVEGGTTFGDSIVSLGLRFEPNLTAVSGASPRSKTRSFLVTASISF